jgi:hypothetical protein
MVNSVAGGAPCCTVIVALVKARSVIVSVQFEFGQPGAPAIGLFGGGLVVTVNVTLPFLTSDAGRDCEPETETGAGFCPGGCEFPEGLVQVAVAFAVAARFTRTSPAPSPANAPVAVSVRPLSVKDGLLPGGFRWTLLARAVAPAKHNTARGIPIFFVKPDMTVLPDLHELGKVLPRTVMQTARDIALLAIAHLRDLARNHLKAKAHKMTDIF